MKRLMPNFHVSALFLTQRTPVIKRQHDAAVPGAASSLPAGSHKDLRWHRSSRNHCTQTLPGHRIHGRVTSIAVSTVFPSILTKRRGAVGPEHRARSHRLASCGRCAGSRLGRHCLESPIPISDLLRYSERLGPRSGTGPRSHLHGTSLPSILPGPSFIVPPE